MRSVSEAESAVVTALDDLLRQPELGTICPACDQPPVKPCVSGEGEVRHFTHIGRRWAFIEEYRATRL